MLVNTTMRFCFFEYGRVGLGVKECGCEREVGGLCVGFFGLRRLRWCVELEKSRARTDEVVVLLHTHTFSTQLEGSS